jgi:hypothetical protein
MFEAVVASEATRSAGNSAAARKLQRNKNVVSSAATADQLRSSSKADYTRGVPMTAAQKRLVKNKLNAGGLSVMQQAAALAGPAAHAVAAQHLSVGIPHAANTAAPAGVGAVGWVGLVQARGSTSVCVFTVAWQTPSALLLCPAPSSARCPPASPRLPATICSKKQGQCSQRRLV